MRLAGADGGRGGRPAGVGRGSRRRLRSQRSRAGRGGLAGSPGGTTRLTPQGDHAGGRAHSRLGTQVEFGRATWDDTVDPLWRSSPRNLLTDRTWVGETDVTPGRLPLAAEEQSSPIAARDAAGAAGAGGRGVDVDVGAPPAARQRQVQVAPGDGASRGTREEAPGLPTSTTAGREAGTPRVPWLPPGRAAQPDTDTDTAPAVGEPPRRSCRSLATCADHARAGEAGRPERSRFLRGVRVGGGEGSSWGGSEGPARSLLRWEK